MLQKLKNLATSSSSATVDEKRWRHFRFLPLYHDGETLYWNTSEIYVPKKDMYEYPWVTVDKPEDGNLRKLKKFPLQQVKKECSSDLSVQSGDVGKILQQNAHQIYREITRNDGMTFNTYEMPDIKEYLTDRDDSPEFLLRVIETRDLEERVKTYLDTLQKIFLAPPVPRFLQGQDFYGTCFA